VDHDNSVIAPGNNPRAVAILNAILRIELPSDLVRRTPDHWVGTECNHLIMRIDAYHLEWKILERR
jgi:hypothetical protein